MLAKLNRPPSRQLLHSFELNQKGRDFVVGDIHGNYDKLMDALNKIDFNFESDRLFACGDLIDRGPKSLECLELMYEPWFFSVRGNHEQMMFDVVAHGQDDGGCWIHNGGQWYLESKSDDLDATIFDLSERMPYGIEVQTKNGKVGIVHADVPLCQWEDNFKGMTDLDYILWARARMFGRPLTEHVKGVTKLYVGHTIVQQKVILDCVHHIDYGVYYYDTEFVLEQL